MQNHASCIWSIVKLYKHRWPGTDSSSELGRPGAHRATSRLACRLPEMIIGRATHPCTTSWIPAAVVSPSRLFHPCSKCLESKLPGVREFAWLAKTHRMGHIGKAACRTSLIALGPARAQIACY
ncbi:uncharacterized protein HMPREF1120_03532 [Exophiala dermatitidis NIH/UT8656]|uniref:Uncharacterized protein n=1 Tax=Exophiala dermatitidis (strain ATCC 34100 / CBS 525.76 / NIH/UT8656) TaxID=858893 RepID=H6BXG2_EXODN|nr:uncharacterized protein HMPREF1120_03532 [Exophiala dermatitidis NIH/UT8656]EHY55393.1 hypothetical protein HMPREF1120_03532 [Exophiala dermatitidis NIH/UT8656]